MDFVHLHLLMNHIPFLGTAFALVLLFFSVIKKNNEFTKIFLISIFLFALFTIVVYLTGEPAEEIVENNLGIGEDIVDKHEEAALISLILMEITGAYALGGLILLKGQNIVKKWFKYSFFVLVLITIVSFAWTANLGGEIRHSEIRADRQFQK